MKKLSSESPIKTGRYLKSEKLFFRSSKLFAAQITDLLDFVWPTAAAMWNLRWQVQGYLQARDHTITVEELHAKFGSDSKIIRPNYYRACIESSWEEQQEQFATFLLINAFAYYESWISETLHHLQITNSSLEKSLQFPSDGHRHGVFEAISQIKNPESEMLRDTFFPVFSKNKQYSITELNNLLICYRYFKDARNSIIHRGGVVDNALELSSKNFETLSDSDLKVKEKPAFFPLRTGGKVKLNIRGVVGFLDIALKIVTTLDAEFLCSLKSEHEFEQRWKMHINTRILKKSTNARKVKIASMVRECGFPRPKTTQKLEEWLVAKSLIV